MLLLVGHLVNDMLSRRGVYRSVTSVLHVGHLVNDTLTIFIIICISHTEIC